MRRFANRWGHSASAADSKEKGLLSAEERAAGGDGSGNEKVDRRLVKFYETDKSHSGNMVTTAKYSLFPLSFHFLIWKNLWEQFQRAANIYFLIISVIQVIPGLSPTGRFTTLIPLCVVFVFTMLKDTWEDWKRRVQDRVVNNRMARVYRDRHWQSVPWREVLTGDLLALTKGDPFPADLVLLWSSEPHGMCYIETSSLDGETNLKLRQCPEVAYTTLTRQGFDSDGVPSLTRVGGHVVCELPNNRLYNFDGYLEVMDNGKHQPRHALSADNVLLRGSELRNTRLALGVAIFTGADTKLMRNMNSQHHKTSRVDGVTNRQIFYVFWFQIFLAAVCAIGFSVEIRRTVDHWYLATDTVDIAHNSGLSFITFTILFNSFIPISLYIMLEVVKVIQGYLMGNDAQMYHAASNTAAMVRNSRLNEELGQVEYVFSDKTGTFTCNMMEFKKFSCAGRDAEGNAIARSYGEMTPSAHSPSSPGPSLGYSASTFSDRRIANGAWMAQENKDEIRAFVECMAVCHTVVPEVDAQGRTQYQASSPDEACLVRAAQNFGIRLISRSESAVVVENSRGQRQTWQVLTTIEFTSARKRMSMVVKDPLGRLQLLVKGADNVVLDMLKEEARHSAVCHETRGLLAQYAGDGLRTLVFARADLSEDTFRRWKRKYDAANTEIHDRHEKVELVLQELERDLDLIGTTAIEDKLQDGVPETIELLGRAGMKLWVLTGDKQETAINIGYSCNLLHNRMGLFTFDGCDASNIRFALEKYILDVEAASVEAGQDIGLIIQGSVLQYILPTKEDPRANEEEADLFVSLAIRCKAVICCRVSPIQKAQLVEAVKERVLGVTLAIGDGANDVSMIQMAHVGIGISGLEGLQAARASDYSIAQFRFLRRLLLVHGRWNYLRIAKLISFTFYKNMALYMTQFIYAFYNLFTGQSLYDSWALAMYNLAFTSFPIMALAVFDKDVGGERLLSTEQFPELYLDGAKGRHFNTQQFLKYMSTALFHSLICFFLPTYAAGELIDADSGRSLELQGHAITAYTAILIVVTAKCGLEMNTWTIGNLVLVFYSIFVWYLFLFLYTSFFWVIKANDFAQWYGMDVPTLDSATSWLTIIVVVVIALLRDVAYQFFTRNYYQDLVHVVQEHENRARPFNRFDVKRALPWLFPKQELKEFKPSLSEGVGRHRFAKDTNASIAGDLNAAAITVASSPSPPSAGGYNPYGAPPSPGAPSPMGKGGDASLGAYSPPNAANNPHNSSIMFDRGFSGSPNNNVRFAFSTSFAASVIDATGGADQSASPGRRRQRITDLIEEDEYEMQRPIILARDGSPASGSEEGSPHQPPVGGSPYGMQSSPYSPPIQHLSQQQQQQRGGAGGGASRGPQQQQQHHASAHPYGGDHPYGRSAPPPPQQTQSYQRQYSPSY